MKKTLYLFLLIFLTALLTANAQMQLKLHNNVAAVPEATLGKSNLQSNLQLTIPETAVNFDMAKGMLVLAFLLDATFPIGEDFSNFAGTGFSGHVLLGYLLTQKLMLTLTGGYIKFGDKDFGDGQTFKQTWSHSQIPILLGINYLLSMKNAFRLYMGLALGLYLLKDSYTNEYLTFSQTQEGDETSSKFGIAPRVGAIIAASAAILINIHVMYSYIFHEAGGEGSPNLSQFSVLAGIMLALSR